MGSRRTTIVNNVSTVTVNTPRQPSAQPTVTSGRIAGTPTTYTIGAIRTVTPFAESISATQRYNPFSAFFSTPYVPTRPTNVYSPVTRISVPAQSVTNNSLNSAGTIKDEVCDEILGSSASGIDSFTVCGNGKATRFRFPESGAPSEILITNLSNNAVLPASSYNVLVRGESVSWLIFDTAPADGVCYNVKYVIGDSASIRTVIVGGWTSWLVKLNALQRQLIEGKNNSLNNQSYRFGYSTTDNRIPESGAYDQAINAVVQLKQKISSPGRKMDLKSVEAACNFLEDQLAKINAGTGKRSQIDASSNPLVATPAVTRGPNIVFEFDDRYNSFSGSGNEFSYNGKIYSKQYDSTIKANYFDLNAGRVPTPPPTYYDGSNDDRDNDRDRDSNEDGSLAPTSSPRPQPRPERSGTGVTGGTSGVSPSERNVQRDPQDTPPSYNYGTGYVAGDTWA